MLKRKFEEKSVDSSGEKQKIQKMVPLVDPHKFFSKSYTSPRYVDPIPDEIRNAMVHFTQRMTSYSDSLVIKDKFSENVYQLLNELIKESGGGITQGHIISMFIYLDRYMASGVQKLQIEDIPLMVSTLYCLTKKILDDASRGSLQLKDIGQLAKVNIKDLIANEKRVVTALDYNLFITEKDYEVSKIAFDQEARPDFKIPLDDPFEDLYDLSYERPTINFNLLVDNAEEEAKEQPCTPIPRQK